MRFPAQPFLRAVATILVGALVAIPARSWSGPPIEDFVRHSDFQVAEISPDGVHIAVTLRKDGEEVFAVLRRDTNEIVSGTRATGPRTSISRIFWVNNERIVYKTKASAGWYEQPYETGSVYAINYDGTKHEVIAGYRVTAMETGTRIQRGKKMPAHFDVIDRLEDDEEHILAVAYLWGRVANGFYWDPDAKPRIYRINVYNGKLKRVDLIPYPSTRPLVDPAGVVRFAYTRDEKADPVFLYKQDKEARWRELPPDTFDGEEVWPLSFSADGMSLYYLAAVDGGTKALKELDLKTMESTQLYHDPRVSVSELVYDDSGRRIVAVGTHLIEPEYYYLDKGDARARAHRMLVHAFAGKLVEITGATDDGKLLIVRTSADTSPGDYYLFDTEAKQAQFLMAQRSWIDLRKMAGVEARAFEMRDGQTVFGYVTWPRDAADTPPPLVVLPHGGPHGVRDWWEFDPEAQLLASRGYAVLQLNFRGSGGYGVDFQRAGYRQWGALMQDDLTDATRALIAERKVDGDRVCIIGHSYGGYAALMGVAREPELYRCAIGSMGVYDLTLMHSKGDITELRWGEAYLDEAVGDDPDELAGRSPVTHADKIEAAVMLIHGRQDERVPIAHAEAMMRALDEHGKPYEWMQIKDEGHGYYDEGNRVRIYTAMLEFLGRHLGPDDSRAGGPSDVAR